MYYKVRETDEAVNDVSNIAIHIFDEYKDIIAAERFVDLYSNELTPLEKFPLGFRGVSMEHRGYEIRLFPFKNYNIFFVVREKHKDVVILRVLHQLQNWTDILKYNPNYHMRGKDLYL